MLVHVLPPSVDLKRRLLRLKLAKPPFSFMPAMYTVPVTRSPVICTSRASVPGLTCIGLCHVAPLSVEKVTNKQPMLGPQVPTLKLFQEKYMRPKKGEDGLLSAQPDSRSSEELVGMQK